MKKLLSTLLALTMLFACVSPVFADNDDGDVRDTNFFTEQPRTELNYSDLKYEHVDPAPLLKEVDALKELAKDGSMASEFETRFLKLNDDFFYMAGMWRLIDLQSQHDTEDTEAADEAAVVYDEVFNQVSPAVSSLIRDVLKLDNACSKVLSSKLSDKDIADYLEYEEPTQEERDLSNKEVALENKYETIAHGTYTTTIDGVEYDADGVFDAFMTDHTITLEQYLQGCHECYGPYGELYLEMIDVRNQIAKLNGYDNYADYAYAEIYQRDYTVEEIDEFRTAVKKYLAPQLAAYRNYRPSVDLSELPLDDSAYTGEGMFDTLAPYFGQISDELLESMQYVQKHGSYDIDSLESKADRGFSTVIYSYNMPFYYNYPYGNVQDLLTTIHEMGHNNEAYWLPNEWYSTSTIIDTAEVHSQALELLMTKFYPELFGTQAEELQAYETYSILSSIISGCLHDEIQCYAYSTPDVTFEMICQKYRQLSEEYGNVGADDPRPEMYGWTSVHHTFNSAMYFISYATSAAGAFAFWEEAQSDYFAAVDRYLEFTANSGVAGFSEVFESVGMESPLSASYIQKLAKTAHDKLFFVNPYTDVYTDMWYAEPVYIADYYGLMNGVAADKFAPSSTTTREQAMTVLARLYALSFEEEPMTFTLAEGLAWAVENEVSDGTNPTGSLTREQFVKMLYNFSEAYELELTETDDLSDFSDAASVSSWAQEAVSWAVGNGLMQGSDGKLNPQGNLTRAEMVTLLQRFAYSV